MISKGETVTAYHCLESNVRYLHAYWYMFGQLYRAPEEKQTLLNKVAPGFFVLLEKALIRAIFLQFRLLTEKPVTMGKRNASLRGVLEAIVGDTYENTPEEKLVVEIESNNSVKNHVNKGIAHLDWDVCVGREGPPGIVELHEIEAALANTRAVVEALGRRLGHPTLDFTQARVDEDIEALREALAKA